MLSHSCQVPSNKILTWTVRTWAILLSSIFIALAAPPRLAADTAPTFTSATSVTFPQGIEDTFTITTSANPVAKITSSGKLPGGVKFVDNGDGTATLSGTPAAGSEGVYSLTITAANGTLPNAVQLFTLRVQDTAPVLHAPAIISSASTTFTAGTEGIFTIHTTGVPTATLSLTGTQPSWLSFIDNTDGTASLAGIPDLGSNPSYTFSVTATNGVAPNAMQSFTLF